MSFTHYVRYYLNPIKKKQEGQKMEEIMLRPDAKGRINLGLMCINDTLRENDIFCSRSMIRRTFNVEKAKEMALQNIKDISKLILWNNDHDIFSLRIS